MRKKNYIFIVSGKAYAPRSSHVASYKDKVKQIVCQHISSPLSGNIDLRLEYVFRESKNRLDQDNLSKTYCDALEGVAYTDDNQVHHSEVTLYNMNSSFKITGVPLTEEIIDCFNQEAFTIVRLKVI